MSQEFNTLELARVYENQGYFQDAFNMYQALAENSRETVDPEITAGLHRMESALKEVASRPLSEERMTHLMEQWLMLVVLQKRGALIQHLRFQKRADAS